MTARALLIGSNYTSTPSATLQGCINDIVNVRNTLIDAYGYKDANITMLRDDDKTKLPTKKNILSAMATVINSSTAADTVWIHYSGHGTQIRSVTGDESDKLDECIVPSDFVTAGFIDDNAIFNIIRAAKCKLFLCFDSCHSGTVCDLQYSVNCNRGALTYSSNNSKKIENPNIIMLSGCRDAQTSADAYNLFSKQGTGAFTITFLETLRSSDHNIDLLSLYKNVCANLQKFGFSQIPVLTSSAQTGSFQFSRAVSVSAKTKTSSQTIPAATKNARGVDSGLFPAYKVGRKLEMKLLLL